MPRKPRPKPPRIVAADLESLVAAGLTQAEMAARLGVPRATVVEELRALSLHPLHDTPFRVLAVGPSPPQVHNGPPESPPVSTPRIPQRGEGAMPNKSRIDDAQLQALVAEGLSKAEMARRLGVPRPTLVDRMRKLGLETRTTYVAPDGTPEVHNGIPVSTPDVDTGTHFSAPEVHQGTPAILPEVDHGIALEMLTDLLPDLQELAQWWRARREALQDGTGRDTERVTFHVEQRWIAAIRQRADQDGTSITHVVNQAFRQFFQERST
jgi:DNA-binding XRE family transcriptional regulator